MSDVLNAQTLIPAARNPVIVIVTPSLDYCYRQRERRWFVSKESLMMMMFSAICLRGGSALCEREGGFY